MVFTDWIFIALGAAAVPVLHWKRPEWQRPYRVPFYPVTPLLFVAMSTWFVSMTVVQKPAQAWAGLAFLALGVPVYLYWKQGSTTQAGLPRASGADGPTHSA